MLEIASNDISSSLLTQAKQCLTDKTALKIEGNNSRPKIANDQPVVVSLKEHTGVIQYEPSELVIKVRAGTPVTQIQTLLKQNNQQLGTDFPDYGNSTFGGAIATGQTGSGRPFLGAIRDQVLGLGIINGQAQALNFGGQVMKNVAGYDVSRLLCGSAGKYAIITDVTLKVVPLKNNITVELDAKADALTTINKLAAQPLPISAAAIFNHKIVLRLSGSDAVTAQTIDELNAQASSLDDTFWASISNLQHEFFNSKSTIWQARLGATQKLGEWDEQSLIDWCGHIRYIKTDTDFNAYAEQNNIQVLAIKNTATQTMTSPNKIEKALKEAFDPNNIFK